MDEGEESFPRGGQETLTPLEKRVIQEKAKEDLLFSEVCVLMYLIGPYVHVYRSESRNQPDNGGPLERIFPLC